MRGQVVRRYSMKKFIKITSNCLIGVMTTLLLFLLIISSFSKDSVFNIGGYSLLYVSGDSMYPKLKDGDFIVINRNKKDVYDVKDIVSFMMIEDNKTILVTHEIKEVIENDYYIGYVTQGINHNEDDGVVIHNEIIGEYKGFRIPLLGYVVKFSNTRIGYLVLVVVPLGIMSVIAIYELMKEVSKKKGEK